MKDLKENTKTIQWLVLVCLVVIVMGCSHNGASKQVDKHLFTVETKVVTPSKVVKQVGVSGNVEGNKTIKIGFLVAGKIDHINFAEGDVVPKGSVIASLDPESYAIAKEIADANLDQTQDEYDRLNALYSKKSLSESDFTKVATALRVAKAQQHLHAKNLNDTKILAPISGVLLKKGVEEGEIIDKGLPLFVLSDIALVKVNAAIPESDLHLIKINQKASVYITAIDSTVEGEVIELGSLADGASRTFPVKIAVKNSSLKLKPGMTAEVTISTAGTFDTLLVPADAVLHDIDNSAYLFVVDSLKNQAIKRVVAVGAVYNNQVQIVSGLEAGEVIVTAGQRKLNNGSAIVIKH